VALNDKAVYKAEFKTGTRNILAFVRTHHGTVDVLGLCQNDQFAVATSNWRHGLPSHISPSESTDKQDRLPAQVPFFFLLLECYRAQVVNHRGILPRDWKLNEKKI